MFSRNKKGFTLIELLIVIVIIGILAGVVLSVLNPAKAQRKSAESVLKATTEKLCLGLFSCAATVMHLLIFLLRQVKRNIMVIRLIQLILYLRQIQSQLRVSCQIVGLVLRVYVNIHAPIHLLPALLLI